MSSFKVCIEVTVNDEVDLYEAAFARALSDGLTASEAENQLKPGGDISVSDCLCMLFDPGMSPAGCKILGSFCE